MIIDTQCVQIKCISRMFDKNLKESIIHLFRQTVYYSVSPSSKVPIDPLLGEEPSQFHAVLHFGCISYVL